MRYAIVYSSMTGNTALLARTVRETLPGDACVWFGAPDPKALEADTVYVGFWTDKGTCSAEIAQFLQQLTTQRLFLFATAGFGGDAAYFARILGRAEELVRPGVPVIGTFMCQGKMPASVRARYETMEDAGRRQAMLDNFDRAASHPDGEDLSALAAAVRASCGASER